MGVLHKCPVRQVLAPLSLLCGYSLKAKGVKNFGIHSFLASNTVSNEYYPVLARQLFELAVKLEKETGAD